MTKHEQNLWQGVDPAARNELSVRDYKTDSFAQRLRGSGVEAGELAVVNRRQPDVKRTWIPGVEIFGRKILAQLHRGSFGEFVRENEGVLKKIGFWPKQWSGGRMFAGTAKGFHRHPASISAETKPETMDRR